MKLNSIIFLAIATFLFQTCGSKSDQQKKDCPIPPPEAIFKKEIIDITKKSFSLSGRDSEESVQFRDGSKLTIFQSGCKKISQEYRFNLPPQPNINKADLAIERLNYMANLDPDYITFRGWSQAIDQFRRLFMQSDTAEVEAGFFVGIDKVDSKDRTTLIIKLFEK